jgi:SAM-dependent methyltransferase
MVRHASSRNEKYITKGTVDLQQGNLSSLPFSNNFFSKAVSNNTIYFWRNPLQEAKELLRVLQPGGLLVIGFRTGEQLWEWSIARKTDVFQHYDPDELEQLLQEAGFHTLGLEHKQELNGTFDSFAFLATKPR